MPRTPKRPKTTATHASRLPVKPRWRNFLRLRDEALKNDPDSVKDFLSDRKDAPPQNRELFGK